METNKPVPGVPGWNAHRRSQEPLRPPSYLMKDVPKCAKNLEGSELQEIRDRNHFKEAMAEMVLLCTEAMRRTCVNRCSSKPLSLEYIADRLDVDDPLFGYIVRSSEGMLQGFISLTTFTNWQKSFRWDSLHELAFYYDDSDSEDEDNVRHRPKKERQVDRDGSLARELAQTVRLGDPYTEGIVWPRIAEITLLGALGCGRKLVQLAIEQLEFQKPTENANYDYIALQATDNSIPFYESLGFVRVGAVTAQQPPKWDDNLEPGRSESPASTTSENSAVSAEPLPPSSPEKPEVLALPLHIVSSPLTTFEVSRPGQRPTDIAKLIKVSVWDIIFLNKELHPGIVPCSRLKKGTILHVPREERHLESKNNNSPAKWFVAKENDTPRKIANKFKVPCKMLVEANLNRLPGLTPMSRLKAGTRVKISNLDQHDDVCDPYCHWSFPDDSSIEGGEPSYMMIRKLDRKTARCPKEIRNSLAVPIKGYSPPKLLLPPPEPQKIIIRHPDAPKPPAEPATAIDIFRNHLRDLHPELKTKSKANEMELDKRWGDLSRANKERYNMAAMEAQKLHERGYAAQYKMWESSCSTRQPTVVLEKEASLFNKVIKLRDDAPAEGHHYSYWFVLTYIPDLKWCHLAPMVQDGVFGPERKNSNGRTKWRLVDEKQGQELDMSSMYCIPVRSKALKKTVDADKEEWDILDCAPVEIGMGDTSSQTQEVRRTIRKQPMRARSAIKPLGGMLSVVKPIKPGSMISLNSSMQSPLQSGQPNSPSRHPHRLTPTKRNRNSPPRVSPRWSSTKQNENDDMAPPRKARRMNNAGARRCALQH